MKLAKTYNILTALFFIIYGLYGALLPDRIAGFLGLEAGLLGSHQIRALWMATFMLGVIIFIASRRMNDQRSLVSAMVFLMFGFAAGRVLGLVFDGTGPMQTWYELGFELFWALTGFIAYRKSA